jgi:hypothetical protein
MSINDFMDTDIEIVMFGQEAQMFCQEAQVIGLSEGNARVRESIRLASRRGVEDAAVCRELAEREVRQGSQGGDPGQPGPEGVQEGAQGCRVWTRRGQPVKRGGDDVAVTGRQTLGWAEGNEACQVRKERLAVLGAPVPGLRQDSSAVEPAESKFGRGLGMVRAEGAESAVRGEGMKREPLGGGLQ